MAAAANIDQEEEIRKQLKAIQEDTGGLIIAGIALGKAARAAQTRVAAATAANEQPAAVGDPDPQVLSDAERQTIAKYEANKQAVAGLQADAKTITDFLSGLEAGLAPSEKAERKAQSKQLVADAKTVREGGLLSRQQQRGALDKLRKERGGFFGPDSGMAQAFYRNTADTVGFDKFGTDKAIPGGYVDPRAQGKAAGGSSGRMDLGGHKGVESASFLLQGRELVMQITYADAARDAMQFLQEAYGTAMKDVTEGSVEEKLDRAVAVAAQRLGATIAAKGQQGPAAAGGGGDADGGGNGAGAAAQQEVLANTTATLFRGTTALLRWQVPPHRSPEVVGSRPTDAPAQGA